MRQLRRPRRLLLLALALASAATAAAVAGVTGVDDGRIGPRTHIVSTGRELHPFGKLVRIGQFPTGGAVTPNGRYYWTVSTGRGRDDVRIVSVRSGRVLQTLPLPGASGGIAMDPAHELAYVAGVSDSRYKDQKSPAGTPGVAGDTIHVFSYNKKTGSAKFERLIDVPPPASATAPQNFPPTNLSQRTAWPDRLAISPDGATLLVPLNLGDAAAIVDVKSKAVRYVETGNYPYGAAILRGGKMGLVSNETPGTVSVIDLEAGTKVGDIQVGPHLSHPESITLDPKADRAYVPLANSDQVVVIDTDKFKVERTLAVGRPEGIGAAPVDTAVTPDGTKLLVANSGTDELLVFSLPKFSLIGRIPTAQYPADVEVVGKANPCGLRKAKAKRRRKGAKRCSKLLYIAAKGLGTGPNLNGPQPNSPADSDDRINETQYLPLLNVGSAAIADFPSAKRLRGLSRVAQYQIYPTNAQTAPTDTPLRAGGPIKYVFYIVRENRTYDQILGDDARGDGDPKLALFGGDITPNAHALAKRFPLLDHVYANSEASIDGHFWTSAAKTSDYVNKAWFPNYGGRDRPYDFGVYAVTWPSNGFLFDQMIRQRVPFFNFGEAVAGTVGVFPDKDRTNGERQRVLTKQLNSDLGAPGGNIPGAAVQCYPNDASIGKDAITGRTIFDSALPSGAPPTAISRTECFRDRFRQDLLAGPALAPLGAAPALRSFYYLVLTNDHTRVLSAGAYSPKAMIADNDLGLGQIVDTITHSSIWKQSAIFVIEDDSQDGADHVDAHRMPAFVISPFAKQGAVIHTRYDMVSAIRSMELILGLRPLGIFDALATPMYDAFQAEPSNDAPYDAVGAKVDLLETNPAGTPGTRASAALPRCLDCISQRDMDALLWRSIHGWNSEPPPPGPNAEGLDRNRLPDGD